MKFNPHIHNRRSVRLKEYDYSMPGEYFITICTKEKECLFGDVVEEEMKHSQIGVIATHCWEEIPRHFQSVELDECVVMPNHVHGIIIITDRVENVRHVGIQHVESLRKNSYQHIVAGSIGVIVRSFKSAVSRLCHLNGHFQFTWQPNYYDRIIRDEKELNNIREYIRNNPLRWFFDEENPARDRESPNCK
jgi:Transposase and inactivated derivatives